MPTTMPKKTATKSGASNPLVLLLAMTIIVSLAYNMQTTKSQKKVITAKDRGEAFPGYYDHPNRQLPFNQLKGGNFLRSFKDDDVDYYEDDGDFSERLVDDDKETDKSPDDYDDIDFDDGGDGEDVDVDDVDDVDDDSGDIDDDDDDIDSDGDAGDGDGDGDNDPDPNDTVSTTPPESIQRKDQVASTIANTSNKLGTDTSIRKWGCDLTETPLIFVHVGKSGGGSIRARLAASAVDYDRKEWAEVREDKHYYPVLGENHESYKNIDNVSGTTARIGRFCNSQYPHYIKTPHVEVPPLSTKSFEGDMPCNATTPLGIAVACPHAYRDRVGGSKMGAVNLDHYRSVACDRCDDDYYLETDYYFNDAKHQKTYFKRSKIEPGTTPALPESIFDPSQDPPPGTTCDIVLTAHTNLGTELNYLPPRYLKEHWWDNSKYASDNSNSKSQTLEKYWDILLNDRRLRREKLKRRARGLEDATNETDTGHRWCPSGYVSHFDATIQYDRPPTGKDYMKAYETCGAPLAAQADEAFLDAFFPGAKTKNYSPFYASMPLHRVTMMRDPWSWAISKFFWHRIDKFIPEKENGSLRCQDYMAPVNNRGQGEPNPFDPITGRPMGWIEQFAVMFMHMLCGNDCRIRWENGMMSLEELEEQTASNLRNAFSVVGILEEEHSFFDMVTDRIQYVDLSRNLHVKGGTHATRKTAENVACKELFGTNETFRESVRRDAPSFAALERIYHVGVEVNRFQKEEIQQCKLAKGEQPTKADYTPPAKKPKRSTTRRP